MSVTSKFTTETGTGAVDIDISEGKLWLLKQLTIHLDKAGGGGNLTVTVDSVEGSAYDVVLLTQDMTAVTNFVWAEPLMMQPGDVVTIAWANAGGARYGIQVVTEPIY